MKIVMQLHVDVTQELETLEMELAALKRRKVQGVELNTNLRKSIYNNHCSFFLGKDSSGFKPLIETSREVPVEGIHKEINRLGNVCVQYNWKSIHYHCNGFIFSFRTASALLKM